MKRLPKIFIISFLILLLMYVCNISAIPNDIVLFQGEHYELKTLLGLNVTRNSDNYQTIQTSSDLSQSTNKIGHLDFTLNLFGAVPLKNIQVNVIPRTYVVPLGNAVGLKLYTSGVLVVGMGEIEGADYKHYKPYENSGIKEGDRIISINEKSITCTADLINQVNESRGNIVEIEYVRDGSSMKTMVTPTKGSDNTYKLGLWVRDAAAGVGTVSFYEPSTKMFAALGHGIQDVDTGKLLEIAKGNFVTTKIISIVKGKKGNPGKIQGSIENSSVIGQISKNTDFGVFGTLDNLASLNININDAKEVASRDEIKQGKASIICMLEDGKKEEYEVEIQKIYKNNNENNKSMLIKITDKKLLEKTGGIIQGMSGSPIIQNNKVIGALTHVLVGDPETGYGVFADLMIKQARQTK
ncbi:MAG: SpoIVB peptidase [Clostridia bacterium]|nr:SpoIVB peptidase [Clostridia bacterium]